jgi:L,D-peptidoglycan transpeptidase YkuD (ErfK/YbiS/YcfS/YnhG family)
VIGADDLVADCWGVRFRGRRFPCAIGRGGFRVDKREGDGATPVGVFCLEHVFYRPDRVAPPRGVAARPIRPGMRWSDDPADPDYNSEVLAPHRWSAETLWRADPLYDLIGVLDYNRGPAVPGMGSAIFLHVWRRPRFPTEGCVAFRRGDLCWILDRWTPRSRVVLQA